MKKLHQKPNSAQPELSAPRGAACICSTPTNCAFIRLLGFAQDAEAQALAFTLTGDFKGAAACRLHAAALRYSSQFLTQPKKEVLHATA
jgi:hypothetical protein